MTPPFIRLRQWLHRIRYGSVEFSTKSLQKQLKRIDRFEGHFRDSSDQDLRSAADHLRHQAGSGVSRSRLLPETFALVREAADRVLGMRCYDEQLMAGLVLDQGKVAEMQTGEGKALAAVAPALPTALFGRGVHVLTFNDYLARRGSPFSVF